MTDDDYEVDWEDDGERDVHARIPDLDTGMEIHISTVRDDDCGRLVDCRAYDPTRKEYGHGVAIRLTDLHDFLELVGDAVWQQRQSSQIENYSRAHGDDGREIHLSTKREEGQERFVVFREYQVGSKEYDAGVTIPVGLLSDFNDGLTDAWHANGAGNWDGELGPYMGADGPDDE